MDVLTIVECLIPIGHIGMLKYEETKNEIKKLPNGIKIMDGQY
jgi:hypothetical protein